MKNAILIHGCCDKTEFLDEKYPSGSNSHWFPWMQKQLNIAGIESQTPEMPTPYQPIYSEWKRVFEQFIVNEGTILVGHSCGGGFLLRWLGDTNKKVARLILVAPYFDPKHENEERSNLTDFQVNSEVGEQNEIHIFYSSDDPVSGVKESVNVLSQKLPQAIMYNFTDKGHFCYEEMKTEAFPELLEVVLK